MNAIQHLGSATLGFFTANEVVQNTVEIPKTKSEVIALVSAVLVQTLIYGVSKFFSWLNKKNEPKAEQTATPTPII